MKVHFVATIFLIIALTQVEAIAKGRNVTIQEIPWLVMIKSNDQIYSGVLVEENLVLTLATICNKTVSSLTTYMGASTHMVVTMNATEVKQVYIHPEWGKTKEKHHANVCLIKLSWPYKMNRNIQKAALMEFNETLPENVRYHAAGWGPANLADIKLISKYPTVGDYKVMTFNVPRSVDLFYIQYNDNQERILYTGDEGGPIFIPEYGTVFGLVSHIDNPLMESHFVAVKFTRLRKWIEEIRQRVKTG